ncbi:GbsR/MarR family transcriptional regulator [Frigidibacter mobilis]|uniref:MarR family transcriptional regulator n=1 Tax=Frigidibacter mobilis TaxID=1335048 RepID=A0A159Z1I1_9RHOB|nr:MarR family transcriptional regulator [Frigidibacter mobilis]AMY67824.1 MarR family transcriptional regulator [Frigidibacter mobilis]
MPDEGTRALFAALGESLGLSRPAALCFAAIWRAAPAPCADDLVLRAGISRSNVSTALKELRSWGLVAIARIPGDRREYFVAPSDPWALIRQVLAERQRRALAPALDRLRDLQAAGASAALTDLADTLQAVADWQERLAQLDPADLAALVTGAATPEAGEHRKKKKKSRKS